MDRLPLRIGGFTVRDNTAETQELLMAILACHYHAERIRRREWFSAMLKRLVATPDAAELEQCAAEIESEFLAAAATAEAEFEQLIPDRRQAPPAVPPVERRERVPVGYDRLHDPRD